jgi:surface carbohydrate biosynthesis protein
MAKSMRRLSRKMFSILRQLGHEIVAWDEEGLVRWPDEEYWRWRLSPETMDMVSHLLAWGEDDADWFRRYPGYPGTPIHITGNPRIDLLRPELRDFYKGKSDALKRRYGRFVLINTNFSKVNHFFPHLSELKKALEEGADKEPESFDVGKGRLKQQLFDHFLSMLPKLCSRLKEYTIVLRLHPAENHAPYIRAAEGHTNMVVINEDSVTPWLMATDLLIANGCTTMIEAAVLGTPTIAYQPVRDARYDDDLPNAVSHRAFTLDRLLELAQQIMAGQLGTLPKEEQRRILDRHLAALDGPLAAERIVGVLEEAGYLDNPPPAPGLRDFLKGCIRNKIRTLAKRINMYRPGHRNNIRYHNHRFPGTSVDEITQKIRLMGSLLGGKFENLEVRKLHQHIFHISDRTLSS